MSGIRDELKSKLRERPQNPHVPSARLHDLPDCYKVNLRTVGYRLVYQVDDKAIVVAVIAVGRRDKELVYRLAEKRV